MIFQLTKYSLLLNGARAFMKKSKTHVLLKLIHCFIISHRNTVIREKGKVHDLSTDKMLFALKRNDCFYARKAKRAFYCFFESQRNIAIREKE